MFKIKKEDTKVEVQMHIDSAEWEKGVEKVYETSKNKFNVVGFRKGHAPRKVIEKQFGDSVFFDDTVQYFLEKTLNEVLQQNPDLEPVAMPTSQFESFTADGGLKMKILFEIVPDFKLCQFKDIEIEVHEAKVQDKEVEHVIHHLLEDNAKFEAVDRAVKTGDSVVIDYTGYIDDKAFDGGAGKDYPLEIGSHSFIDNFEEQLIGHKKGDEVDVNVTFPDNYQAEEFQGKKALFKVTVKEVSEKILPEFNDKFVADTTEFETVEEYRNHTIAHIQDMKDKNLENELRNNFMEYMIKNTEVKIPDVMVDEYVEQDLSNLKKSLTMYGMTLEAYVNASGMKMEDFMKRSKERTLNSLKSRYIYRKLIEENDITLSKEEQEEIAGLKTEDEAIRKENEILLDKLFAFVKENIKIKYIKEKN